MAYITYKDTKKNEQQRKGRYLLLIVGTLGLLAIIAMVALGRIKRSIESDLISSAKAKNITLRFNNSSSSFALYTAKSVEIDIPGILFGVTLDNLIISSSLPSLLTLKPKFNGEFGFYEGHVRVDGKASLSRASGQLSVRGDGIDMATHPRILMLGFSSAKINFDAPSIKLNPGGLVGDFEFFLKDGERGGKTRIPLNRFGIPMSVQIPAISNINLDLKGSFDKKRLALKEINLDCSLGKAHGHGEIEPSGARPSISIELEVTLYAQGMELIEPFLPFILGEAYNGPHDQFAIYLTGPIISPKFKITPVF